MLVFYWTFSFYQFLSHPRICETEYFNTLLKLFKQYSWNNFLHSEVDKCLGYVFACSDQNDNEKNVETNLTALQKHVSFTILLISCNLHDFHVIYHYVSVSR